MLYDMLHIIMIDTTYQRLNAQAIK